MAQQNTSQSNLPQGTLGPAGSDSATSISKEAHAAVGGAYMLITAHAEAVMNQPAFAENAIKVAAPHLNDHLKTLQGYAETWLSTYQKDVLNTLQLTIGYNNKFQSFYTTLSAAAKKIAPNNNEAATFVKGLDLLQKDIQYNLDEIKSTYTEITTYRTSLESSARTFQADLTTAQAYLGSTGVQEQNAVLFSAPVAPGDLAALQDAKGPKLPDGLKSSFKAHNEPLNGGLVVNEQKPGAQWAVTCVSFNSDGSYKLQKAYVVDLDAEKGLFNVHDGVAGHISALQAKYEALQDAMKGYLAMEIVGPMAIFGGMLMVVVGVVAEIPTAGVSTGLVIGGVATAGAGAAVTIVGGIEYQNASRDATNCLIEIAGDEYLLSALPHVMRTVRNIVDQIIAVEGALSNLVTAWTNYSNQMNLLKEHLSKISVDDGPYLQGDLDTAQRDWARVSEQADTILNNLQNRPPTVVLKPGEKIEADNPTIQAAANDWKGMQAAVASA